MDWTGKKINREIKRKIFILEIQCTMNISQLKMLNVSGKVLVENHLIRDSCYLFMMHNNAKNLHKSPQTLMVIDLCKIEGPFENPYILGCAVVYLGYCLPVL
jgi:hypothetical protein